MNKSLKNIVRHLIGGRRYDYLFYRRHHSSLLRCNGFPNRRADGEEAYVAKWRQLSRMVDPCSYRLFSHYCGPTPDIIPEDIMHSVVERRLNPREQWKVYEDKNNFARFVGADILPRTIASRQGGDEPTFLFPLSSSCSPLILKPSLGTSCGESIMRFDRVGEEYRAADGTVLDEAFLTSFGPDWVLQEAVAQHPDLQRFCTTAVCTVRLVTYRSVADGTPHVTAAILRVGHEGAVVDNIDAGGRFLHVDIADGRIRGPFFSRDGSRSDVWNGFDIAAHQATGLYIPCWNAIVDMALRVATCVGPHHLLALDITVDDKEKPMLIEYNIGGFTTYFFHFTGQTVLGPWTDEVIAWCR